MSLPPMTVVRSETHLEIELLRLGGEEVEFLSPEAEAKYEHSDRTLAQRIELAIASAHSRTNEGQLVFTNLDWWPNKSRSVTVSEGAFSASVLVHLSALLIGEFADWKIHVHVCKAFGERHASEIGSLCILADRVIIQESLHERLRSEA